jgi:hypothetical protein
VDQREYVILADFAAVLFMHIMYFYRIHNVTNFKLIDISNAIGIMLPLR